LTSDTNKEAIERTGINNLMSTERNFGELRTANEKGFGSVKTNAGVNFAELRGTITTNFKESMLEVAKGNACLERQAAENAGNIKYSSLKNKTGLERQAGDNFANIQIKSQDNRHIIERQASDNLTHIQLRSLENKQVLERQAADYRSASQLEAFQNKEHLARQLAECCCEIKEMSIRQFGDLKEIGYRNQAEVLLKMDAKSYETNNLIREVDTIRIRDKMRKYQEENLLYKLRLCGDDRGRGRDDRDHDRDRR